MIQFYSYPVIQPKKTFSAEFQMKYNIKDEFFLLDV